MRKILALLALLCSTSTYAQQVLAPNPPTGVACAYNLSLPTLTTGNAGWAQCDQTGHLLVTGSFSATTAGFTPSASPYATLAANTTTNNVALPTGTTVLVYNLGTNPAYVNLGTAGVTATTANIPVPAGTVLALSPGTNTYLAAITTGGADTLTLVGGSGGPFSTAAGGSSGGASSSFGAAFPATGTAIGAQYLSAFPTLTNAQMNGLLLDVNSKLITVSTTSSALTNPTSTLTMTSATTAYTAGQLIANNATAGSITVPSFSIANTAGGAFIPKLRLAIADNTSTAWPATNVQVDLWTAAPTFTNGDRAAFLVATGSANHIGAYTCTLSAFAGDGFYGECAPAVTTSSNIRLASGTSIYWTLQTVTGGGITGASKVWTLTPEIFN